MNTYNIPIQSENFSVELSFYTQEIVRIRKRSLLDESSSSSSFAVTLSPEKVNVGFRDGKDEITITSSAVSVTVNRATGAVVFLDAVGNKLLSERHYEPTRFVRVEYPCVSTLLIRQAFELDREEAIYGLGQRQNGLLSQRATSHRLINSNGSVSIPMFQSVKGYGVYFDHAGSGSFEDSRESAVFSFDSGTEVDYYFMYGGTTDGVVALMRKLTGDAPMLPLWSLGFWQSRERYRSQAEFLEVLKRYRDEHIPLDGMIQDWQYWGEDNRRWNDMTFAPDTFPDPVRMAEETHAMHAHAMIVIWPSLGPDTEMFKTLQAQKMLFDFETWPRDTGARVYDVFNPAAREKYWARVGKNLLSVGFDAWWMDSSEPDHFLIREADYDDPTAAGPFRDVVNAFPLVHTSGAYEYLRREAPAKRVCILTRSAFAGQQRTGANTWSGDTVASWNTLRAQISAGLGLSLCGIPFWNSDIGGFFVFDFGDNPLENPEYHELYARWMQFGAFCPMMRSHGTCLPREVYLYGEQGTPIRESLEKSIRLRYVLLAYNYAVLHEVNSRRGSFMRPLAAEFAADTVTHTCADEYLYGHAFLVAPVVESQYIKEGKADYSHIDKRRVYLPCGTSFYDFWTGERYEGGQEVMVDTPIDIIPLFVKAGSVIPINEPVEYAGQKAWDNLELRIYPGADGTFTLYEDEFDNYNYEQGLYSTIEFSWNDNARTLVIGERRNSFPGMLETRRFRIVLVGAGSLSECGTVIYNGHKITVALN